MKRRPAQDVIQSYTFVLAEISALAHYFELLASKVVTKISREILPDAPHVVKDAFIISPLVLLRNIDDFFREQKNTMDHITAQDYGYEGKKDLLTIEIRDRLNEELSHLTYGRLKRERLGKDWDLLKIVPGVLAECRKFLTHIEKKGACEGRMNEYDRRPEWESTKNLINYLERLKEEFSPNRWDPKDFEVSVATGIPSSDPIARRLSKIVRSEGL